MSENNLIRFDVRILGRKIPLKIEQGQETATKQVVDEINQKIAEFQLKYEKVDKLDSLIMVLLSYVFDQHNKRENTLEQELLTKIKNLGEQI